MSNDPTAILVKRLVPLVQPFLAYIKGKLRMIFGDVAQMIGDRPTHIEFRIVFQCFEQRQGMRWVILEVWQAHCPRQSWSSPFTDESTNMGVGILRPTL